MSALKVYSPAIILVLIAVAREVFGIGKVALVISPLLIAATVVIHIREEQRLRRRRHAEWQRRRG